MSEWRSTTLGALCRFKGGNAFPSSEQGGTSGSTPFIKVSDLSLPRNTSKIVFANNWVSEEQVARLRLSLFPTGASVFAKIGEGMKSERVRQLTVPTAIDNNLMAAVPASTTSVNFLYYLLQTVRISSHAVGSALPYLKQSTLEQVQVRVPALVEQQAIAEVLGALDDKIAANTAHVASADELMHQTFLSTPMSDAIPLSSTADFINGKAFTKGASGTGRVVVRIAELNAGISGSTVFSDASVDDRHVARPGDILFAWSGSLTLRRWFRDDAIVNQHIFKVIPRDGFPAWLSYALVNQKLETFKGIAADKATTMGHIQRHHLDETVQIPSTETVAQLDPLMSGLWSTALNAERESVTLTATRDALLPHLMSGKLRVRDAEAIAAAAGV